MKLKQQIDQDLKTAMLAGDKTLVSVLRGLKSSVLNAEVAKGAREKGLGDGQMVELLSKEAKKRQESADLYSQAGEAERAEAELAEKAIIQKYLPKQLSKEEISSLIDEVVKDMGEISQQNMGMIIGQVKKRGGVSADGALIASLVKGRLQAEDK